LAETGKPISSFFGRNREALKFLLWQKPESQKSSMAENRKAAEPSVAATGKPKSSFFGRNLKALKFFLYSKNQ
jgi:hypothetical protein